MRVAYVLPVVPAPPGCASEAEPAVRGEIVEGEEDESEEEDEAEDDADNSAGRETT